MERSLLLERVFQKVEEKGHINSMTVRFFLGALLDIMLDKEQQEMLPEEVRAELRRAHAIFLENSLDVEEARAKLAETDEVQTIADITAIVAESDADATVSKVTYRLGQLVKAEVAERAEITVEGTDGAKARKVKGFRKIG